MTNEREGTPHPTKKKKEGNPHYAVVTRGHLRETFRVTCGTADRSKKRRQKVTVIREPVLPTPSPGDVAGTRLLNTHSTLTRLEDQERHFEPRTVGVSRGSHSAFA